MPQLLYYLQVDKNTNMITEPAEGAANPSGSPEGEEAPSAGPVKVTGKSVNQKDEVSQRYHCSSSAQLSMCAFVL